MDTSRDPCAPGLDEDVIVSAVITDNSDITNAEIIYTMDGGGLWQTVIMTEGVDDIWTGIIPGPGVNENVHVFYYISATDDGIDQDGPKTSTYPYEPGLESLGYVLTDEMNMALVQFTPYPSGNSLYDGCEVTVTGIVTGDTAQYNSSYGAYAIQGSANQWDGIVFDGWDDTQLQGVMR